jgi:hypothetical protein
MWKWVGDHRELFAPAQADAGPHHPLRRPS